MLRDKVTVVTGGASGIGKEMCLYLARKGALVVIADVNMRSANAVSEKISHIGGTCRVKKVDVTVKSEVEDLVNETVSEFGRIDLLINNAGIGLDGELKDVTYEQFKRVIDVNLWGTVNGTFSVYPIMIEQGYGQIVNVSSLAGLLPGGLMTSYVASKQAVAGLALALRSEAHQYGIKVNALCPGFIETPIHDATPKASSYLLKDKNQRDKKLFPTAERCVNTMMKGIERNKAIIIAPRLHRVFWWLYRLFPALVPFAWRKIIERLKR